MASQEKQQIYEQTRSVYHAQHQRIINDDIAMKCHLSMFSLEYFRKPDGYFTGKKCLDAGCGDTAKVTIALHKLGAEHVTSVDIGNEFIPIAYQNVRKYGVPDDAVSFLSASVTNLPFPSESFDFVACHGVIVHLPDVEDADRAFSELARVTRRGGDLYIVGGLVGGLFEDSIIPALRNYYRENSEFRQTIDNLTPEQFLSLFDFIAKQFEARGETMPLTREIIASLFDVDFCVTIQNEIQAPVRLALDESFYVDRYLLYGFESPTRLRRYVERKNIRRFFAPLHYHREHPISKLLYGSGNLEFISRKL